MKLVVDNDFFCKTEVIGIAELIRAIVGSSVSESFVLPTLAGQLSSPKSKLYKAYAADAESLRAKAKLHPHLPEGMSDWTDKLIGVNDIDPGEVRLIAFTASSPDAVLLATHDKRCLAQIPAVNGLVGALSGKVLMLEEALQALCKKHGYEEMRKRIAPHLNRCGDSSIKACFGSDRPGSIEEGLAVYIKDMRSRTDGSIFLDV